MSKVKEKLMMIVVLKEYIHYLSEIKGEDFSDKFQEQLEKDSELSHKEWTRKYKPLWNRMKTDEDFDKYCEESPELTCECGSANIKYIGEGELDKDFDIKMYKYHCFTCDEDFEASLKIRA